MRDQIAAILNRIEGDIALLRKISLAVPSSPTMPTPGSQTTRNAGEVPVIKGSYSRDEAEIAKADIEAAFLAGMITWDKKRGLKMLVTKATEGWTPDKRLRGSIATSIAVPDLPDLKSSYSRAEAEVEKSRIEDAYLAGLITPDKKRGLKMVVTKSTEGWTPGRL